MIAETDGAEGQLESPSMNGSFEVDCRGIDCKVSWETPSWLMNALNAQQLKFVKRNS
jgi:hypothetical protein